MPEGLSSAETVSGWEETSSNTLHKTSPKGITCLDLHPSKPNLVRVFLVCVCFFSDTLSCGLDRWSGR